MTKLTKEAAVFKAFPLLHDTIIDDPSAEFIKDLAALGFILIPIEPSEEAIEAMARGICLYRAMPACNCVGGGVCRAKTENLIGEGLSHGNTAQHAYAALVKHERKQ